MSGVKGYGASTALTDRLNRCLNLSCAYNTFGLLIPM